MTSPAMHSKILTGLPPSSFRCLNIFLFPRGCHAENASEKLVLSEALYKFSNTIRYDGARASILPKPMMHIAYPPYFHKIYNPPISTKFINFLLVFVKLRFLCLIYFCLLPPPILTMMHLYIMLHTYWTPLIGGGLNLATSLHTPMIVLRL